MNTNRIMIKKKDQSTNSAGRFTAIALVIFMIISCFSVEGRAQNQQQLICKFPSPSSVFVGGLLGEAILNSEESRLRNLPDWNNGELIRIFSPESRALNKKKDWYGEHAGKWLYSMALSVNRSGSEEMKELLLKTANSLIKWQEEDGYLGTYSVAQRLTAKETSHKYSWDVWNLSYMTLGLLKVNEYFPHPRYSDAALKIGELFLKTFGDGQNLITDYGTRKGISATVILDPIVELYTLTKDEQYLNFAELIIRQIEKKEGVRIVSEALRNKDLENVGEGKAYQLIWNLTAIVKLYQITENNDYLIAAENAWQNIVDHHLSITGGPWGGIGKHYECFNRQGFWSPYGFIETCSVMSWIQLNRELFECSGKAKYFHEIEKSAYNALLGAQFPNGDWSYHSFANGCRHAANFNDCCPSSGTLALEELPELIYSQKGNGIACNIYGESAASITLPNSVQVRIVQETEYPFDDDIRLSVFPSKQSVFPIYIRIPDWAKNVSIRVNSQEINVDKRFYGDYLSIERLWKENDIIEVEFPFEMNIISKSESIQKPQSRDEISRVNWIALKRGPLTYATNGLIDGKEREKTYQVPDQNKGAYFSPVGTPKSFRGPAYELQLPGTKPQLFLPYYEAGGRMPGKWRLSWIIDDIEKK